MSASELPRQAGAEPAITVVIPARNAEATIGRTLAGLEAQDLTQPFEVIVVDDGSTDATAALVERSTLSVQLMRIDSAGSVAAARNQGVAQARAPIIAFTDADCEPVPGWLRAGLAAFGSAELVQGAVRPASGVMPMPFDRSLWVTARTGLFETANLLVRRDLFDRIGGFEDLLPLRPGTHFGEDALFGWRAERAGARFRFEAAAAVDHAVFRRRMRAFVAERTRARFFPALVRAVPELRRERLFGRIFLAPRTCAFDVALLGAIISAGGQPLAAVMAIPYVWTLARESAGWHRHALRAGCGALVADLVRLAALVVGSVRWRSLVL